MRSIRGPLATCALAVAVVWPVSEGAQATTTVSGDRDTNAPLVIDPSTDPADLHVEVIYTGGGGHLMMLIHRVPVTKRINRVTLGGVARPAECPADTPNYKVSIRAHQNGSVSHDGAAGGSDALDWKMLPGSPGQVSWDIQPITLRKGEAYSIWLRSWLNDCNHPQVTTFAHNEAQVNRGDLRCETVDAGSGYRMWHVQGEDDAVACGDIDRPSYFSPDMPTGWLEVVDTSDNFVWHPYNWHNCWHGGDVVEKVHWRKEPGTNWDQYVCRWTRYPDMGAPEPAHGWYYAFGTMASGPPRDMYLRLDTIDYEALLNEYVPEFRYDDDERFYPMAASSITDFYVDNGSLDDSNGLKGSEDDPEQIALANPGLIPPLGSFPADQLSLDYLSLSYPSGGPSPRGGTAALDSDFLSERGSHSDTAADDARIMQNEVSGEYFGKIYGHVAADSEGRTWLQYFRFYYYNDQDVFGVGSHEGDWESVQVRLGTDLQPDLVSYEAHNGEETCHWADVQTHDGRPIAWVGAASHAAYSRPGQYRAGLDNAQGDGYWLIYPNVEMVTSETPWMQWPGRWGDSGGNSPQSPLRQGAKWDDPEAWIGNVDDCDMGDPF